MHQEVLGRQRLMYGERLQQHPVVQDEAFAAQAHTDTNRLLHHPVVHDEALAAQVHAGHNHPQVSHNQQDARCSQRQAVLFSQGFLQATITRELIQPRRQSSVEICLRPQTNTK
ncbi:hypothetical protein GN244_ATG04687 [Phytophthora infestans]|uniref:Uncharacterized protein n=1 Tax=Phytophthora infestans TaxID=4787 RepID=A0A833WN52_PHYIN|nr:hypothetical protein GN244_ATG04687 [Phytophthora infestans]